MEIEYRIVQHSKNDFTIEEFNEKLRNWEAVLVWATFIGETEQTSTVIRFSTLEEAKQYIAKLKDEQLIYPIYHSID